MSNVPELAHQAVPIRLRDHLALALAGMEAVQV